MKPKNILIVMHGAGLGGVEKSLKTLCKYLDRERFRPIVALPSEGPLKSALDGMGITTIVTPMELWTPIKFHFGERHYFQFLSGLKERISALVKIIEEEGVDIVHSATLSVADGAFAAKVAGRPHIWHIHGKFAGTTTPFGSFGSYFPLETLYALVNALSTRIVAVSEDVRQFVEGFLPGVPVQVIYNGIDLKEFGEESVSVPSIRDEFSLQGKLLVVLIGRVASVKGVEDFVESAIKMLTTRNDTAFLVVGSGEDKALTDSVMDRIRSMKLSDRIILTGKRLDIPSILQEADVFVCSSKAEGFPYSCLEAMSAFKPVVTTRCGGPEEMVIHGKTGFHVPVGSADEIARAVTILLDDAQLRNTMGREARELAETTFGADAYARNFEDVYRSLHAGGMRETANPWRDVFLRLASDVGELGKRTRQLEQDVRDLRNFEAKFKDNFLYRGLKRLFTK